MTIESTVSLVPNLGDVIAHVPAVQQGLDDAATKILAVSQQLVPVRTGKLQGTGRVVRGDGESYVVYGGGEVDYAAYVEFGTSDTPAFAYLRRAVEAAGYSFGTGGNSSSARSARASAQPRDALGRFVKAT